MDHDTLFKWLITSFAQDFFAFFFPQQKVSNIRPFDKEFLDKYEGPKSWYEADMLMLMEVVVDGVSMEVAVCLEHKSWRADVSEQLKTYFFHVSLMMKRPVWCVAFFTDAGKWRKPVRDKALLGISAKTGPFYLPYDIIKLTRHKSSELLAEQSLFCALLALKADGTGVNREAIVREIYLQCKAMGDRFSRDHGLLVKNFINTYSEIQPETAKQLRQELDMGALIETPTEYYINIGREEGLEEGLEKGELRALKRLLKQGLLSEAEYKKQLRLLKKEHSS